jgi:hypothetical protein
VWNTAKTSVCAYLSVDSVVGNRLFFAVPRATLSIPSSQIGVAGDNLIPTLTDEPLDSTVYGLINNQVFNVAMTDIRPEDAKFATTRGLTALDTLKYNGLGYGPGPIGSPILSAFSTKSAQVVDYAITGNDPITGQPVKAFSTTNIGGEPVVVFVNSTDTGSGGLGSSTFQNVDRFVLSNIVNGTLTRTRDIAPAAGLPSIGIHTMLREPLSGTMNTFEFCVPRSLEVNSTQELNVNPAVDNPLNKSYTSGGTRQRVIGTGEMVSEVGAVSDSLGYAFWSTGNFASVTSTTKYLTIDGVDPLNFSYTGGFFPTCIAPCPGIVTFAHVADGSYPAWTILRAVTDVPAPAGVKSVITQAQTQATNVPDLLAFSSMQVFRSHYLQSGKAGSNGHRTGGIESGGDVGGAVFTIQADKDNITDFNKEFLGLKQ